MEENQAVGLRVFKATLEVISQTNLNGKLNIRKENKVWL